MASVTRYLRRFCASVERAVSRGWPTGAAMSEPSTVELHALSEHVLYEVQVLFGAAAMLERHTTVPGSKLPWLEHIVTLEACVLHARSLVEFLFREPSGKVTWRDDGLAAHFFAPGEWGRLCPPRESTLDRVSKRVGKEIAHLNYGRASITDELKTWPFAQIAAAVGRPLRVFIDHVPESRVVPNFRDRVRTAFPDYLRFPIAVSYPPDSWPPATATRMADAPSPGPLASAP